MPEIRRAQHQDATLIIAAHRRSIRQLCSKDYNPEQIAVWSGRDFQEERWRSTMDKDHVWVIADQQDNIFGFGHLKFMENQTAEIAGLYFVPEVTGQGFGKKLAQIMFDECKKQNTGTIYLTGTKTATSIWIDQKKWDGMKEEKDRAMLLLHEITMQIYLMKFENFQSFCKFSQTECPLPELWNETKSFAPTKRHALAARDYDNIRAVTFWIATNGKTASKEKFHAVFAANDFDARLFGTKALENSKRLQAEQTLSYDFTTVKSALSRSQILNKMPDKCYALNSKVEFDCTVTTTPVESKYGQAASIKISAPNFSRETIIYYASGTSEKMRDYHDSMSMFALSNMSCQVGSVSNSVYVYAFGDEKAKPAAMEILSVTMQPLVTYASEGQMASAAQPKVTSLETDTIIAYRSDVDFELGLLKYATGLINQSTANTTRPCN
jgi:N-acetylglutamate synthase-like GNAT family acetyltransferase